MKNITQSRKDAKIFHGCLVPPLRLCGRAFFVFALLAMLADCLKSTASAELPSIRFDRINPLGAGVGTSVEVEVAGRDTEDVSALRFDHPGLKAELLKPGRFKITVAGDVPEGT